MTTPVDATGPASDVPSVRDSAASVRGSTVMLAGRLVSLAVTFLTQVLIIRGLSKTSYGSLAYALSVVALVQSLLPLGMDRADTRFFALYDENGDRRRLLGTLVLQGGVILSLGGFVTALVVGLQGILDGTLTDNGAAVGMLALLIALAPVQALDDMVLDLFAVFARPGAVFVRRFVLTPGLRLAVVLVVVALDWSARSIAIGYLVTGLAASAIYVALVPGLLRGAAGGGEPTPGAGSVVVPVREVMSFSLPLMTSSLVFAVTSSLATVILGHERPAAEVAAFRAVQPVAVLVTLVMSSFSILFTPVAARLFARGDRPGLHDLYWQTAAWIALLSFPIAALATAFAEPVVSTLFGARYHGSAGYLAILAAATYVQSATGFNGVTLQIAGRVRYVVTVNIAVTIIGIAVLAGFTSAWGAMGAATGTAVTLVGYNFAKQVGLGLGTGVQVLDRHYLLLYAVLAAAMGGLVALQHAVHLGIIGGVLLTAAVSVALALGFRSELRLAETFPQLRRLRRPAR